MLSEGLVAQVRNHLAGEDGNVAAFSFSNGQISRIGTIDRGRYPRKFLPDELKPTLGEKAGTEDSSLGFTSQSSAQRIQYLEKSIEFLRKQHDEILTNLHSEIEVSHRKNRDLHDRLILQQKVNLQHSLDDLSGQESTVHSPRRVSDQQNEKHSRSREKRMFQPAPPQHARPDVNSPQHSSASVGRASRLSETGAAVEEMSLLKAEIKTLKQTLRDSFRKNDYLKGMIGHLEKKIKDKRQNTMTDSDGLDGPPNSAAVVTTAPSQHDSFRPPTLPECYLAIDHLQKENKKQAQELAKLKADLREIYQSKKWAPDTFLLAKNNFLGEQSNVAASAATSGLSTEGVKLPHMAFQVQSLQKPIYPSQAAGGDSFNSSKSDGGGGPMSLPALPVKLGNRAVERRKRTQVLQRAKIGKDSLSSLDNKNL